MPAVRPKLPSIWKGGMDIKEVLCRAVLQQVAQEQIGVVDSEESRFSAPGEPVRK